MRELPLAGTQRRENGGRKTDFMETGILHASWAPLGEWTAQPWRCILSLGKSGYRPSARKRHFEDLDPDLAIYRQRTIQFLRRYFRMSMEVGRVPSLLGREVFRTRVTSYRMGTFEDTVIFVHDIERCLQKLDPESQSLIVRIVFQDYSQEEAAGIFGCTLRTLTRRFQKQSIE